ncbi:G patch domain-containing protein 3-like isoform X1 [Stegodyphus dumicola]|uniref:G patch domain-containing protein 3-like isoform X1 n=1 Tax=Stegodyphus dumicola TaxID=202533 RepID=UPI0015B2E8A8|nr:G patch domain-containing protein 3-like isoform X1 [Stegodyphus dumicola]
MALTEASEVYLIVNNIPKHLHASDLRNFFSAFTETGGFLCFHYRHRPEVQKPSDSEQNNDSERSRRVTNCCIIKVVAHRAVEFIKTYNGEHWLDNKGETLVSCCFIKKIILSEETDSVATGSTSCKRGTINANLPLHREKFTRSDLDSLIEMHPPTFMPNGNVGTKTSHFLEQIKACRLPPSLISKLGLQFPRNRSKRIYGNVPFEYKKSKNSSNATTSFMPKVLDNIHSKESWSFHKNTDIIKSSEQKNEESESEEEEWDRHEALHEDVTGQERTKERLFEEEIELKWEKGGSGLVFYTDAQFWDAQEGDFDAKTADDWDIDMSIYNDFGPANDKDSQDLARMRLERNLRDGTEAEIDNQYDFAAFEKYSTGFGRKILESQGWKQGQGIGKHAAGIPEPILNDGQHPLDKKGFGYRGEKLNHHPTREHRKRKRRHSDDDNPFFISTIYDNPKESDPPETVLISSAFSRLKYRKEFLKEHGCDT